jgi:hypothetical protein
MESSTNPTARRSEDIALDLLKFVSAHANLGGKSSSSTTGFGIPSSAKPEDQVAQIFDLYARCREAVESPAPNLSAK